MSFVHRRINISFGMGQGATGQSGQTNVKLTGLRCSVKVINAGDGSLSTAAIQIYGMPLSLMNQLSIVGLQATLLKQNRVLVEAGDDENGMSVVFQGNITRAWPDMQNAPQAVFRVEANVGPFDLVKPAEPTSFKGNVPFDTVGKAIVKKMTNRIFENNGVTKMLSNPYFFGSALSQFRALAKTARIGWIDENETTVAAWPRLGSRGDSGLFLSAQTGMVGYPIGTPSGILVKSLFKRHAKFGTTFQVQSDIDQACGTWTIAKLDYSLESETPHGEWFITFDAYKAGSGQEGPQTR